MFRGVSVLSSCELNYPAYLKHFLKHICFVKSTFQQQKKSNPALAEMAKSLLTSSLSVRTKLLQTGVSLYNTSHGFYEEEVKKVLEQFPGGAIDLQKKENGIGILTLNNPSKMNAFSGTPALPSPGGE